MVDVRPKLFLGLARLAVEAIGLRFEGGGRTLCDGVNFWTEAGTLTAVMGPAGCGKRGLLNLLTGIYRPTGGRVLVGDGVCRADDRPEAKSSDSRVVPGRHADGWRRNGRQSQRGNQGYPAVLAGGQGQASSRLAGGSQSVRSSWEAGNDRGAKGAQEGGSAADRQTEAKTNASARKG